ncbi:hypothetical protein D3C85_597210 [compost metagenome]
MSDSRIIPAMRAMARQRAKGEMASMMDTYYADQDGDKYERFKEAFEAFVKYVQDEGLQE